MGRINLNDLRFFVRSAESGGFAAAARELGLPKSTVAKRVADLEAALGARLAHRSSRAFVLTDAGRDFFEHARAALIEAETAEDAVRRRMAEPSGVVRITASVPTAQAHLADRLPDLARAHPKLTLHVHVTDRFVDVVQEGFDIAVRSHFAPLPDSDLVQRRLAAETVVLLAAPAYLAARGAPARPEDLAGHDGLLTSPAADGWRLASGEALARGAPRPALVADEATILRKAAEAGLGVVGLPEGMAAGAIAAGALVRVLPEWNAGVVLTTMLTPHRRWRLPSVRAVMAFLSGGQR